MDLIQCPKCQKEIAKSATSCPHCGDNRWSASFLIGIVIGVVILVGIFMVIQSSRRPSGGIYGPSIRSSSGGIFR